MTRTAAQIDASDGRTRVPRAAFQRLRTSPLGLTDSLGLDVAEMTFAKAASWGVWASPAQPRQTNTDWSRDMSVLASYETLEDVIRPDVVFVALNKGTNPAIASERDWSVFHSGRRDYMLARALRDSAGGMDCLWGGYMTDFYKGLPTRSSAELADFLEATTVPSRERVEEVMCDLLLTELSTLGHTDPLLVCLGGTVFDVISQFFPQHRKVKLTHYAASISTSAYAAEVSALCEQLADLRGAQT